MKNAQDLTAALLANVLKRKLATDTRWGIGTAAQYLHSVDGCPVGVSQAEWQKALKEAEGRLTWCDEEMGDSDAIAKSVCDGSGGVALPPGFCAAFDCTLTSKRIDRDGDVLEPKGMVVDKNMPLLWQHLPMQPIGKMVRLLSQDDQRIRVGFGIVDTTFGKDVAVLVKAGCLRMSHGFKPFEFDPIQRDKSAEGYDPSVPVSGWHVKKGEIREGSVVSIPSNVDGIIEAYHGGELKTPLVAAWAKSFSDARPVIVPVHIEFKVGDGGEIVGKAVLSNGKDGKELELPDVQAEEPKLATEPDANKGETEPPQDSTTTTEVAKDAVAETATPETVASESAAPGSTTPETKQAEITDAVPPEPAGTHDGAASGSVDHAGAKSELPESTKAGKVISAKNMKKLMDAKDLITSVCDSAMKEESEAKDGMADGMTPFEISGLARASQKLLAFDSENLLTKMMGMEDYIEGSFEWVQYRLRKSAADYLRSKGKDVRKYDAYAELVATFPTDAIVCVYNYDSREEACYRVSWATGEDGPAWTGDPVEVEIKPQVMEKVKSVAMAAKAASAVKENQSQVDAGVVTKSVPVAMTAELHESPGATFSQAFANLAEKSLDEQVETLSKLKATVTASLDRLEQQQIAYLYAAQ